MKALFVGRGPWSKVLQDVWCATEGTDGCNEFGRDFAAVALSNYEYDVAFIVTPPQAHAELLPLVWARGKPMWVEKPFGCSHVDALKLEALWRGHNKPPCYVNFPHLRLPQFESILALRAEGQLAVDHATAVVGGPGPWRSYMTGVWDWGAHVAAFSMALQLPPWTLETAAVHRPGDARAWVRGLAHDYTGRSLAFMAGNTFEEKTARYQVMGRKLGGSFFAAWDARVVPPLLKDAPLQKAMTEMVAVAGGAPVPAHPNWTGPIFGAAVTCNLDRLCPIT